MPPFPSFYRVALLGVFPAPCLLHLCTLHPALNFSLVTMGPQDSGDFIVFSEEVKPTDFAGHGLEFTNDKWNESIANGESFTLYWNQSISDQAAELRLFRILYPEDGVVLFELVSNLTKPVEEKSYTWTPDDLSSNDLYTFWLGRTGHTEHRSALSPPWKLKSKGNTPGIHWSAPVGIPIVVVLCLYFVSLVSCLMWRRAKRNKIDKERRQHRQKASDIRQMPDERHPSVSTVITVQSLTEDDELIKPSDNDGRTWIETNLPTRPKSPKCSGGSGGVQWNRVVWRNETCAECGNEHMLRSGDILWGDSQDSHAEGPIGQAR